MVGGDDLEPARPTERRGVLPSLLEVPPVDDELGAERRHRAAFLSGLLPTGTTIVTGSPVARPANARLGRGSPVVAETSPATSGPPAPAAARVYTIPPRTLNAPVGVWFSCFTTTVVP